LLVLTVAKGPDRGKVFEMRGISRVIIGRNSPDLKLNDIMISRYHAKLKRDGDRWLVRDMGSRNGTKLNGDRLTQVAILKAGDHIITGYTEFEVSYVPDASDVVTLNDEADESSDDLHVSKAAVDVASSQSAMDERDQNADDLQLKLSDGEAEAQASNEVIDQRPEESRGAVAAADVVDIDIASADGDKHEHEAEEKSKEIAAHATEVISVENPLPQDAADVEIEVAINAPSLSEQGMLNLSPIETPDESDAVASPLSAPSNEAPHQHADLSERAASEWMSAIESQLVVAEGQGWEDIADEEDDGFIESLTDDYEPLEDQARSLLYFDEDDHWAEDVQIDDETLVNSLKEDGPDALLKDLKINASKALDQSPVKSVSNTRQKNRKKK